jgi:hypothetical protein
MKFRTKVTSGNEVLFVGHERGNAKAADAWLSAGRWKISTPALDQYLSALLEGKSFGRSIESFVFCFEIADFENWGNFFRATADYTSYRPKFKEIWSVGQLRWTKVAYMPPSHQLQALRGALQEAICRVGKKQRKPKDFAYLAFASEVDALLAQAPEDTLLAKPAVYGTH